MGSRIRRSSNFHHCGEHLRLLWGVRTNGSSLWGIRRFKWMELGFKESYFYRTLLKLGWKVTKHVCEATTIGTVLVASRHRGVYEVGSLLMPPDEDCTWALPEWDPSVGVRYSKGRSVLTLDGRSWRRVEADVINSAPFDLPVKLTCGGGSVSCTLKPAERRTMSVSRENDEHTLIIETPEWVPRDIGLNADGRVLGVAVQQVRTIA